MNTSGGMSICATRSSTQSARASCGASATPYSTIAHRRTGEGPCTAPQDGTRGKGSCPSPSPRAALPDLGNGVGHYASDRSWPLAVIGAFELVALNGYTNCRDRSPRGEDQLQRSVPAARSNLAS